MRNAGLDLAVEIGGGSPERRSHPDPTPDSHFSILL